METESLLPKASYSYGDIKRYLRRRRYQRLEYGDGGAVTGGKKTKTTRLRRRARRQLRIKAIPKLTWMVVRSPLKMMAKLKSAYMNFMLKSMTPDNMFGHKNIPKAIPQLSNVYAGDAFEARLIFEISKALVASHELYPM
ncbi:hypothetical protein VNO78_14701 [Psophocarpus tetragonolobus]|uniref:Uncharacterized protein n=1 Tax=Psophocarpus tetragonolobus TaxID=3891 RepID=A0AAN9SF23_PSOTE